MKTFKRIALFLGTNILVMITISILLNVFKVQPYLTKMGINYESLLIFCLAWGMVGSFIALMMSKFTAKMVYKVRILKANSPVEWEKNLVAMVSRLAQKAQIKMPEVGVYESPEVNAFATGPTRNRSLVAVSSGLLDNMDLDQLEGVLAHEVAHVSNGDMVTMALVQGIINAFAMFLSRVLAHIVGGIINRDRDSRGFLHFFLVQAFDIILTFLGMIVVCWFSRHREFRADEGAVKLASKQKMVSALEFLRQNYEVNKQLTTQTPEKMRAMKIFGIKGKGLGYLFSTHPSLTERIENLTDAR